MYRLCIALLAVIWGISIPTLHAEPQQQPATPTPAADLGPDSCERNNTSEQACVLTLDSVNGPYSFLPRGDQDYYSINLGDEPTGLATEITVRGTDGLDLRTTIKLAGANTSLALFSTPAISTTLPVSLTGWLVIRVENRSPQLASWETYGIEIRQSLPPAPTAPISAHPGATAHQQPDLLENNYDVDHAAPIAVGTVYDLNFTCPASWPGACQGGDHDYVTFATKAKHRYLIATIDLQTTDTVLDLFWGDRITPLTSNDDAYGPDEQRHIPGGFASVLRWVAPSDGWAIVRIAPRTGGIAPIVADDTAGSYRFAVALAGSALAAQIEQRLSEQAGVPPSPTPAPVQPKPSSDTGPATTGTQPDPVAPGAPAGATNSSAAVSGDVRPGSAIVQAAATKLHTEPNPQSPILQEIPQETRVDLKGQISGVWVRVEVDGGIAPGWVDSRHLRRLDAPTPDQADPVTAPAEDDNGTILPPGVDTTVSTTPRPAGSTIPARPGQTIRVATNGPAPTPTVPLAAPQASVITLEVCAGDGVTTDCATPLAGVRAELLHAATRALLIGGRTDTNGQLRLPISVPADTGVLLHLPTLGLLVPLQPSDTTVPIRVPSREGA